MNIFIFDYSGYGFSRGRPSEKQLYQDGQDAIDYIFQRKDFQSALDFHKNTFAFVSVINLRNL